MHEVIWVHDTFLGTLKNTTAEDAIDEELVNDLVHLANEAETPQDDSTSSYKQNNSQGRIY